MRAVGAKVAVGVIVADMVDVYFPAHLHGNGYWHYLSGLVLRYFYRKQLRLDHPSKLVALGLHFFCAYSATIV